MRVSVIVTLLALAGSVAAQDSKPPADPFDAIGDLPVLAPMAAPRAYTPPPRPTPDACGAAELQSLVGRPKEEIPVPLEPGRRRVVCTTCPTTQDYSPSRQTIQFDATTGKVTSVTCG